MEVTGNIFLFCNVEGNSWKHFNIRITTLTLNYGNGWTGWAELAALLKHFSSLTPCHACSQTHHHVELIFRGFISISWKPLHFLLVAEPDLDKLGSFFLSSDSRKIHHNVSSEGLHHVEAEARGHGVFWSFWIQLTTDLIHLNIS